MTEEQAYQRLLAVRDAADYVIAKPRRGWVCYADDAAGQAQELGPFTTKREAQAAADEHILRRMAKAVAA